MGIRGVAHECFASYYLENRHEIVVIPYSNGNGCIERHVSFYGPDQKECDPGVGSRSIVVLSIYKQSINPV